jgi:hypothetical protein
LVGFQLAHWTHEAQEAQQALSAVTIRLDNREESWQQLGHEAIGLRARIAKLEASLAASNEGVTLL